MKKKLVCYGCGGVGHPRRLCPTSTNSTEEDSIAEDESETHENDDEEPEAPRVTEAGKDVKMNKADPHVRNGRTGEKTALRKEEGVYVMDANVKAEKEISQRNQKSAPERRKT